MAATPQASGAEARWRKAVEDAMPTGLAAVDLDGQLTYANAALCRMLGWSAAELVGTTAPFLFWPPEEVDSLQEAFASMLAGQAPAEGFRLRLCRRDGQRFEARVWAAPLLDGGRQIGWLGSIEDLSERERDARRIEELNRELERRMRDFDTLLQVSPIGIAVAEDPECRRIRANPALARMLGISPEDNASHTAAEAERPPYRMFRDGRELSGQELPMQVAARLGIQIYGAELEVLRGDGTRASIFGFVAPLFDEAGEPRGSLGAFLDITERKRAETALRESEARFRQLADAMPLAVWTARADGFVDYYNRRWYEYTGLSEELHGDRSWAPLVHPEDLPLARQTWDACVRGGVRYQIECRLRGRDGGYRWHLVRAVPVHDEAGRVVRWFGSTIDVDDERRAEQASSQRQRLESIGLLAGGVAHDFNNLLTGILGNASLVLDGLPAEHPHRPLLEDLLRGGQRAADLTRQLLAYSGKGRFLIRRIDLSALVHDISRLVQVSIPKKVEFELRSAEGLPAIEADPGQVQQVVMNLVINAAEAIGESAGSVLITTGLCRIQGAGAGFDFPSEPIPEGDYVALTVTDTGCGMDQATRAHMFDPFFTTKFTGRGLGLSAVLGIVRGHRGALRVESQPGRGSTFQVLFPACEGGATERRAEAAAENLRGTGTVLVVDDERLVRNTAVHTLERYGYEVITAGNGAEAIRVLERGGGRISLVLLDLNMPVLSGDEVLPELLRLCPEMPVLLSSGYSENEAVRRFGNQGWAGFVQKPYLAADLAGKVKAAMNQGGGDQPPGAGGPGAGDQESGAGNRGPGAGD